MLDKHLIDPVLHNPLVWLHVSYAQSRLIYPRYITP